MTGKRKLRLGLIGAGGIAGSHAKALAQLKDHVDFAAVSEIDEERGKKFQREYNIGKFCKDHHEILDAKDIDLVDICTPAFNHTAITCEALRSGKWAICEKPVGGSIKEADDILAAERETGMRAASIFQLRFGRGIRALSELMRAGKTGRPLIGFCETFWYRDQKDYYDQAAWRGTWKGETGGCLITHAIHIIDALLAVLGEPEWVCSEAANMNHRIEVDDCSVSTVRFKSGVMAGIVATSCAHGKPDASRLKFAFENMSAFSPVDSNCFGQLPWKISASDAGLQKEIDACLARWTASAEPEGHEGQLLHFIRACRDKTEPMVNIAESKRSLELIAGIYKSAITGQKTVFPIAGNDPFYSAMNGGRTLRGAVKK